MMANIGQDDDAVTRTAQSHVSLARYVEPDPAMPMANAINAALETVVHSAAVLSNRT